MGTGANQPTLPEGALESPDGTQWWDGSSWRPIISEVPSDAVRSPDGRHWWNGTTWIPLSAVAVPAQQTQQQPPPPPTYASAPAPPAGVFVRWNGGGLEVDGATVVVTQATGAPSESCDFQDIERVYVDERPDGDTIAIQTSVGVRSFAESRPRDAVTQFANLFRSQGVAVEERNWYASNPSPHHEYAFPIVGPPPIRNASPLSTEKIAVVGALLVAAALIIVSAFLTWYTFETQGGFPVPGQSGLTDGYGIWVLVLGGYTVVNAAVLAVAASARALKIAVRALWGDVVLTGILLVLGIVQISSGDWIVVGTNLPLTASAGTGIYLLGVGELSLIIAVIRLTVSLRRNSWSWSAPLPLLPS